MTTRPDAEQSDTVSLHDLWARYDELWQEMLDENERDRTDEPEVVVEVDPSLPEMEQRPLVNRKASEALGLKDTYGSAFAPLGDGRWRAWPRISKRGEEIRERLAAARAKIVEHGEQDFEHALREAVGGRVGDRAFAGRLYSALCNVEWRHDDGSRYSCSWRSAGGLVAEMRGEGEDYMDFYCGGREGAVDEDIADALEAHGWRGKGCD